MPYLKREVVREVSDHLVRLGLTECPVCNSSDSLNTSRLPAVLSIGGAFHEPEHPRSDPDANILYFVMVLCRLCGHTMFFDLQSFKHGDEPVFAPPGGD